MNNFCPIFKKMSIFFSERSEKLLYALLITQILKNDYSRDYGHATQTRGHVVFYVIRDFRTFSYISLIGEDSPIT